MTTNSTRRGFLAASAGAALAAGSSETFAATTTKLMTGVNVAGLEFNSSRLPGRAGYDYPAPDLAEIAYYRTSGAKVLRLPFRWERMQPTLNGGFNSAYAGLIDSAVNKAQALGMKVLLDAHQYGRRKQGGTSYIIGETSTVTSAHFAGFWEGVARRYLNKPVIFNLTNEPNKQNLSNLVRVQNEAIARIRRTGATQMILVSGTSWSGAHSWVSSGNAAAMLGIRDPGNNVAFDVHQYFDGNSSGTSGTCTTGSANRLRAFTDWAKANGKRGFLGEFAAGPNSGCMTELTNALRHMRDNPGAWAGWTCWAGGSWWGSTYPFKLRPTSLTSPTDTAQMRVLKQFFQ
jgi:endoglucanase